MLSTPLQLSTVESLLIGKLNVSFLAALHCNKNILWIVSIVMIDVFCKWSYNKQDSVGRMPSW